VVWYGRNIGFNSEATYFDWIPGSFYAKRWTLGASPSFGGRRVAATSEVGACVKLKQIET